MGKELIEEMLDLLVKMSKHCKNMERQKPSLSKCSNCGMKRDFGYSNSGCLLVDTLDNCEFMDLLRDTCRYQKIEYIDKINEVMEIFTTEND